MYFHFPFSFYFPPPIYLMEGALRSFFTYYPSFNWYMCAIIISLCMCSVGCHMSSISSSHNFAILILFDTYSLTSTFPDIILVWPLSGLISTLWILFVLWPELPPSGLTSLRAFDLLSGSYLFWPLSGLRPLSGSYSFWPLSGSLFILVLGVVQLILF